MTSAEDTETDTDGDDEATAEASGIYVYGIVPADVQPEDDATGIHDAPIEIVTHGDIAALVSEIDPDQRLGTPADLQAHARILDGTSHVAPVLPLRFGAVVSDRDAVINELLAEHDDEFASALDELEGFAQYLVRGRYVEETIIREIVEENPKASTLLESIRDQPEELTRDARTALGEIIGHALEAKRETDTGTTLDALSPLTEIVTVREPTHDEDAVQVAVLVEVDRQDELEQTVGDLAARWDDRITMRLVGPMAPYDFVVTPKPDG
ncbi:GvpL/GvpF family gas vesicle protein [Rhodococcus sp. NCIMB 12038]|uniref:GvpL/GvpF family gas vesicle protein n=1 Tax=Rhodococcus sp. NCIMB 12038 TaxID=933800 RepID=UPI000B3D1257|nr:GvpL/GvpF family gas vesicle protein [Rhodococcus sp. NCIMB 12038]OUS83111.1 gas vesicle protein GvpFL [Rhodococcus sp. NCIMB 12038]